MQWNIPNITFVKWVPSDLDPSWSIDVEPCGHWFDARTQSWSGIDQFIQERLSSPKLECHLCFAKHFSPWKRIKRYQFELPLFGFVEISIIEQICNGAKLLQLTFDKIRFIDLGSFFQMPLSAFPKTFGIKELGNFPHLLNTPEHQDCVGPVPALDCYMPESMSRKGKQELKERHQASREEDYEFNLKANSRSTANQRWHYQKRNAWLLSTNSKSRQGSTLLILSPLPLLATRIFTWPIWWKVGWPMNPC